MICSRGFKQRRVVLPRHVSHFALLLTVCTPTPRHHDKPFRLRRLLLSWCRIWVRGLFFPQTQHEASLPLNEATFQSSVVSRSGVWCQVCVGNKTTWLGLEKITMLWVWANLGMLDMLLNLCCVWYKYTNTLNFPSCLTAQTSSNCGCSHSMSSSSVAFLHFYLKFQRKCLKWAALTVRKKCSNM